MTVYDSVADAVQQDPRKRGVVLYEVKRQHVQRPGYVWARANQEALATVARGLGVTAHRYRAGAVVESEVGDGITSEGD